MDINEIRKEGEEEGVNLDIRASKRQRQRYWNYKVH